MKPLTTSCAAILASLLAQLLGAAPGFAENLHPCPPTHTNTVPSPENPGVVLVEGDDLVAVRLTSDFELPWSLGFLPDGSFLVTERPGRLLHVRFGSEVHEVTGTPAVLHDKHGGLLDIAVDPKFAENGLVYVSYLQGVRDASTMRVMKARYDLQNETLVDQQVIFESTPGPNTDQIGGRIALTDDGYLFLTLGDRWDRSLPQDLSTHAGTIIRIKADGSVPADNPFVARVDARNEIWSYGHRNPQGWRSTASPDSSGQSSMGRAAAMSSTSSSGPTTMDGRWRLTAPRTTIVQSVPKRCPAPTSRFTIGFPYPLLRQASPSRRPPRARRSG